MPLLRWPAGTFWFRGLLVLLLCGGMAQAATITVDTAGDGATGCTLRRAVENANAGAMLHGACASGTAGGNTITFDSALNGTAIVLNGTLQLTRSVSIAGNGQANTFIAGGVTPKTGSRVFDVPTGVGITVSLSELTVRNGWAASGTSLSSAGGLFIASGANVNLINCTFENNHAESSGGATENRGTLSISNCIFTGNTARGEGGSIRNIGLLTVTGSTFNGNTAERGGAIWMSHPSAMVNVSGSTFGTNAGSTTAPGFTAYGGALMNADESGATLVLSANSYTGNNSGGTGDVVWEGNPLVTVLPTSAIVAGQSAALSAQVQGPYYVPSGTISLYSGVTAVPGCVNVTLSASGQADCVGTGLTLGVHTITARYSGDSNHASGVSAGVAQVVNGHTNQSISTQVLVSAPEGAAVYVDGALKATVGASGYSSFGVSTSAPDGEKSFAVQTRSGVTVLTSSTLKLWRDTVLPAWSGLAPPVSGYLRSGSTFDYTLSEAAASARITITRTGGAADATVHVCTLQGTALSSGSHQIGLDMGTNGCSTVLTLVNGAIYTLAFAATDAAGNASVATTVIGVTYDTSLPIFSSLVPAQDGALKADSLLEYTLSEAVASASITFTRTGGAADAGSPRVCALQGTALGTGVHQVPLGQDANGCMVALGLIDGAMYTLAYAAADAAGNASAATEVTGVMYDVSAPAAPVVTSPLTVSGVGGTLTVSGTAEAGSRVFLVEGVVVLGSTSISGGAFSVALSGLADGLHNFSLTAQDAAGNVSAPALMGYTVLVQPPPAPQVVIEGAVSVPSGGAVTVGGAVQVSAGPGSTIVLTPQAGGTTITISPVVAGSNMPVTVVVGGQTLQFLADASSAMTLSVVTLVGADGRLQVALVLNPIKTSGSQVTVGGVVSDGTVIALLATSGGNIPMTTIGSGPVRLVMEATPQGSGAPNAWGIYVSQGRISVPVSANTTVGSVNGSGSIEVYPGEVALIGAAGQLNGIRLGTATGGGVGDPVPQTSLPASFHVGRGYARLTGTLDRLGGTRTLDDLVSSQVQEFGFATGGQNIDGSMSWTLGSTVYHVVPLDVSVFPGRADGVTVANDGSIEIALRAVVTRFGPALSASTGFAAALDGVGSQMYLQQNGSIRIEMPGVVYMVRPQWTTAEAPQASPAGFSFGESGLVFVNAAGMAQVLMPDVADYTGMHAVLEQALSSSVELRTGLDMRLEVVVNGTVYRLIPDYTLVRADSVPVDQKWWIEGVKLFIRYADGWVQGFEVLP